MDKNCFRIIYTDVFSITTTVVCFRQHDVVASSELLSSNLGITIANMWTPGKRSI